MAEKVKQGFWTKDNPLYYPRQVVYCCQKINNLFLLTSLNAQKGFNWKTKDCYVVIKRIRINTFLFLSPVTSIKTGESRNKVNVMEIAFFLLLFIFDNCFSSFHH